MPLINNFSLRLTHKIMAIAIVGFAGVILIGGVHMYADSEITRHREAAERSRAIFELSSKIEIELLEARSAEKDFLLRNDQKKAESHDRISKAVAEAINTLHEKLQEIGRSDLAGKIEAMNDALERYRAHFASAVEERLRLGLDEKSGLEGRLRESVHDVETKVNQLQQLDLGFTMLMMRRHEKDFMLRRDVKYGDEMKKRAAEFSARVDSADIPESGKTEIKQKLSDYQRDFFAWFETALKLAVELKATSDSVSEIERAIEALSKAANEIRAEADRADARIRANIDWQMKFAIVLIAFSVIGISVFIGRSVSGPLTAMTAAIIEPAAGNFALAASNSRSAGLSVP
jgi:methyl-accepting chemotaxis protein